MPTSLFCEMDRSSNGSSTGASFEDQRAFQLALELSMLGLSENSSGCPGVGTGNGTTNDPDPLQTTPAVFEEARSKKSQNMTECVPVPSSEHVAEIVGRQGKSLVYTSLILLFFFHSRLSRLFISSRDRLPRESFLHPSTRSIAWKRRKTLRRISILSYNSEISEIVHEYINVGFLSSF